MAHLKDSSQDVHILKDKLHQLFIRKYRFVYINSVTVDLNNLVREHQTNCSTCTRL